MDVINGKHKNTVQRRKEILELLNNDGEIFVDNLSKRFLVSEVTIRKDLESLEKSKLLLRARGGALKLKTGVGVDYRISEKHRLNYAEKALIGKAAAALVNVGDTILVDSGTTTLEMINHLPVDIEITVITNALNLANVLSAHPNIHIIVPGGSLRKNSLSLVGSLAEKSIRNFFVDKTFLGVDGIDPIKGFYTPNIEEAYLNQIMIKMADKTIILSDSTKFSRKSLNLICKPQDVDILITDKGVNVTQKKGLIDSGVDVIIAK